MLKSVHLLLIAAVLVPALSALVGCDQMKAAVGKLAQKDKAKAEEPPAQGTYRQDQISEIRQADYATFISRKDALVVVDFHAEWCGPCKMLGPVLEKAAEAHPGVMYLGKVNVDQAPDLAAAQKVTGIPDVRIFKNGQEVARFVGFPGEKQVLEQIAELSRGISPAAVATPGTKAPAEPAMQPFQKGWMPAGMKRQSATP